MFSIFEVYGTFTRLGIINGLGRELPYYLGQNNINKAENIAAAALHYSLSSNILLFAIIPFLFYFKNYEISDKFYLYGFIVVVFRIFFSSYSSYLSTTFRTSENFNILSNIQNLLSALKLLTLILVITFGFVGLLLREFLLSFSEMALMHYWRPLRINPRFSLTNLVELFKVGFPLFVVSYLTSFIDTIPRLFILREGTIEQLGLFSPIIIMLGMAFILPTAISAYMYPKMSFEFGKTMDKERLWGIIVKTNVAALAAGIPLFLVVFLFSDLIKYVFPKYTDIVPYMKISSFALLFIGYKAGGISFSVLKSWNIMFLNTFLYLGVSVISIVVLYHFFDDVLYVAAASLVITFLLMSLISLFLSYKVTHSK